MISKSQDKAELPFPRFPSLSEHTREHRRNEIYSTNAGFHQRRLTLISVQPGAPSHDTVYLPYR